MLPPSPPTTGEATKRKTIMAGSKRRKITPDQAFTEAYRSHRLLAHDDDARDLPKALMEDGEDGGGDDGGGGFFAEEEPSGEEGGFFADNGDQPAVGGGFFGTEDADDSTAGGAHTSPTHLPISEIPHALTLLDLPSQDRSILSVFENGAVDESEVHGGRRRGATSGIKVISRDNFKKVCEVLMMDDEQSGDGDDSEQEVSRRSTRSRRRRQPDIQEEVYDDEDDDEDEDVYRESSDDDDGEEEEEEEDHDQTSSSRRRRPAPTRRGQRKRKASSSSDQDMRPSSSTLTKSQRTQVAHLWSLFTTKLDEIDPDWQGDGHRAPRLTERELQRLAIVIGEKVSEKDIHEMIAFASTSFAPVESRTREEARARRDVEVKRAGKEGVGIDEFAGVLVRARMV